MFSDRFREYRKRFGGRRDVLFDDGVPAKRRGRSQSQSERRFGNHLQNGQSGRTTEQDGKSTGKRCGKSISILNLLFLRIPAGLNKVSFPRLNQSSLFKQSIFPSLFSYI